MMSFAMLTAIASVRGQSSPKQRYSLYTPEESLMAETLTSTATNPSVAYEYIWFNGEPVAQIETATGATHYYFNDHLGAPLLATSATGTVDWRVEREPYGKSYVRLGADWHQPLGLPGQESTESFDREYNVFRWYRSAWSRYTQPDPKGIRGSANLFEYGFANPMLYSDPLGLRAQVCCRKLAPPVDFARHCFIRIDPDETWALHTKPATTAHFIRSVFDPTTTATVERGDDFDKGFDPSDSCGPWSSSCGDADACVRNAARHYPSPIPYDPFGTNSNTFAKTIAARCGLKSPSVVTSRKPWHTDPVPGWDRSSPPMGSGTSGGW
jgi:RHS repeat-associated protein